MAAGVVEVGGVVEGAAGVVVEGTTPAGRRGILVSVSPDGGGGVVSGV